MNRNELIKQISLTTSVKNRWDGYLEKSLVTWYDYPFKEIVIVDWSSDIPIKEQIISSGLNLGRVKLIRVEGQKYYEHSRARNVKVDRCQEGFVLSIDSDIMIESRFMDCVLNLSKNKFYGSEFVQFNDSRVGTCIFHKDIYKSVGGCNEDMHGWGFEDLDLYMRFVNAGYSHFKIPVDCYKHIPHDDELRTVNTKYLNKWQSNSENMYIGSRISSGLVWPSFDDLDITEEIV